MGTGLPCKRWRQNSGAFFTAGYFPPRGSALLLPNPHTAWEEGALLVTKFFTISSPPSAGGSEQNLAVEHFCFVTRCCWEGTQLRWAHPPWVGGWETQHKRGRGKTFHESLQTPARRRKLTNRTVRGATVANLSGIIGSGEVEEENLILTSTMPTYRSLVQNMKGTAVMLIRD